ncbi:hypothetical protein ACRAWF_19535 [Streptomyces sp. L7]
MLAGTRHQGGTLFLGRSRGRGLGVPLPTARCLATGSLRAPGGIGSTLSTGASVLGMASRAGLDTAARRTDQPRRRRTTRLVLGGISGRGQTSALPLPAP